MDSQASGSEQLPEVRITRSLDTGINQVEETKTEVKPNEKGRCWPLAKDMDVENLFFVEDENVERGNWTGKMDFLLACLGYAVGLGNIWRFPYKCYKNGGGAFFIPYLLMLVFVSMPIFFMELCIGQFTSNGPLTCWDFAPAFQGVGVGMVIVSFIVTVYYNIIIAWAIHYMFSSFTANLPWAHCGNPWNSDYCLTKMPIVKCAASDPKLARAVNGTCVNTTTSKIIGIYNITLSLAKGIRRNLPSDEYFNKKFLKASSGVETMGEVQWELALSLLLAWIIVYFSLWKGVKSSGKVIYFTATFPYVVLLILFGKGLTLDGCEKGIMFYITPKFEKLKDARVWNDAANQIFFSLSTSWGGLITLSSYNRFQNNCLRDALFVTISNCLTSIFAGFVIFSYLGYMAKKLDLPVDQVAKAGTGLAFVVYPDAVSRMPGAPFWSVLFFFMLLTLGLDSQFTFMETVTTSIMDKWPYFRTYSSMVILVIAITCYLFGLLMCTQAGVFYLELLDNFAGGWTVLFFAICECVALMWVYGWNFFSQDISIMLGGKSISKWWKYCWTYISPLLITFYLVFSWVDYRALTMDSYTYPTVANVVGWLMAFAIISPVPIVFIYKFCKAEGSTYKEKWNEITSPNQEWGPALIKFRQLVHHIPGFVIEISNTPEPGAASPKPPAFLSPLLNRLHLPFKSSTSEKDDENENEEEEGESKAELGRKRDAEDLGVEYTDVEEFKKPEDDKQIVVEEVKKPEEEGTNV